MDPTTADYAWAAMVARSTCYRFRLGHFAEDAVSEAYLALWLCSQQHDPARGSLHAYAYRRVRGAVIDALRDLGEIDRHWIRHGCRISVPLNERSLVDESRATAAIEARVDVAKLMAPLLSRRRHAVQRRCLDELDGATVAHEMGITAGRVSQVVLASMERMNAAVRRR